MHTELLRGNHTYTAIYWTIRRAELRTLLANHYVVYGRQYAYRYY